MISDSTERFRARVAKALAGAGQLPNDSDWSDADTTLAAVADHVTDWDNKRRAAEAFSMSDDPNRPPFYSTRSTIACLEKALVSYGLLPFPERGEKETQMTDIELRLRAVELALAGGATHGGVMVNAQQIYRFLCNGPDQPTVVVEH